MKNIYRVYCNACAAPRMTSWTKTAPPVCPYCSSSDIDANSIAVVDQEVKEEREVHVSCGGSTSSVSSVTGTSWTTVRKIIFDGTNNLGTPDKVKFSASAAGGTGSIRLRDLTNNVTIANKSNVTDDDVYIDNNTDNWSTGQATLAVQAKTDNLLGTISVGEVVIEW